MNALSNARQEPGRGSYGQIPPTRENIRAALSHIHPDLPRDEWINLLFAVYDALGPDGGDIAEVWSQQGETYKAADFRSAWKSMKTGKVTVGTLFGTARARGWEPGSDAYQETEADRQARERKRQARLEKEAKEKERKAKNASKKAIQLWQAATPLQPDHGYYARKLPGIQPSPTLRELPSERAAEILGYSPECDGEALAGRVMIAPVKIGDSPATAEMIDESGRKSAIAGGPKSGGYWTPAPLPDGDGTGLVLGIGEGVATVLSAHHCAGFPVVAALSDTNLPNVAAAMRAKYPAARLLILSDRGSGQAKAEQAATATGAALVLPEFTPQQLEAFQAQHGKPPTDFNDLHQIGGADVVRGQIEAVLSIRDPRKPPPLSGVTLEELDAATLNPPCIVENYLYADLAAVFAAGGTGKTTMLIYEAVHIALGRDLWGLKVWRPGSTLFITAEDPRSLFVARFREIINGMGLTPYERQKAMSRFNVWDVSGNIERLAELDQGGNIRLTDLADRIVESYKDSPPAVVVFDPAISFGPGERMVNDGEQAIVTACRRIIRGLGCCVRIIHHTGKVNAREGALDQYAGRGGSALPDGCRMVAVLSGVNDGTPRTPPEDWGLAEGDSGFILARSKLSYVAPQPVLWIRRRGYAFEYFTETKRTRADIADDDADKVLKLITNELKAGRKYSAATLEPQAKAEIGLSRARVRAAIGRLEASSQIIDTPLPEAERHGARQTYLNPVSIPPNNPAEFGETPPQGYQHQESIPPDPSIPPPYREWRNGGIETAHPHPPFTNPASDNGGMAAEWRNGDHEGTATVPPNPANYAPAEFGGVGRVGEMQAEPDEITVKP